MAITREDLARMYPRALPEWLEALYELAPVLGAHYGFDRLDWVHFCGQIAAETNSLTLREMRENMSFSTQRRILEVYSYRLGVALKREPSLKRKYGSKDKLAAHLVRKPEELADIVYGGREGTPWMKGSLYIGRGPTQITHKNNYAAVQEEIEKQPGGGAFDLIKNPDLLATDPELGIRSAFADWHLKGLSRWAQRDDCDTLSDALNTGNIRDNIKPHGLTRRRMETKRAKDIWRKTVSFTGHDPVPVPVPLPVPPVPVPPLSTGDLAKVSRKVRFLVRLRNWISTILGLFTFASVMDALGYIKGVYDEIYYMAQDNALALGVTTGVLALAGISYLVALIRQDQGRGNYVPSGLIGGGLDRGFADEGVEPDPEPSGAAVEPPGPLPAPRETRTRRKAAGPSKRHPEPV